MNQPHSGGWIELICGSMFSGKTEELLRRIRRAEIGRKRMHRHEHARAHEETAEQCERERRHGEQQRL